MATRLVVFCAVCVLAASQALSAGFDCGKASTPVETAICSTPELSKLDDELSAAYKAALDSAGDRASIVEAQNSWLRRVRNACADRACLLSEYPKRISELRLLSLKNVVPAATTTLQETPTLASTEPCMRADEVAAQAQKQIAEASLAEARRRAEELSVTLGREQAMRLAADQKYADLRSGHLRELMLALAAGVMIGALLAFFGRWAVARGRTARGPSPIKTNQVKTNQESNPSGQLEGRFNSLVVLAISLVIGLAPPAWFGHALREIVNNFSSPGDFPYYGFLIFAALMLLVGSLWFALFHSLGFVIAGMGKIKPRFATLYAIQVLTMALSMLLIVATWAALGVRQGAEIAVIFHNRPSIFVAVLMGIYVASYFLVLTVASIGLLKNIQWHSASYAAILPTVFYAAALILPWWAMYSHGLATEDRPYSTEVPAASSRPVPLGGSIGAPFDEIHTIVCKERRTQLTSTDTIRLSELMMEQQRLTQAAMERNDVPTVHAITSQLARANDTSTCD